MSFKKPRFIGAKAFAENFVKKGRAVKKKSEDDLQLQLSEWIQKTYPAVLFMSDIAGRNLSPAQRSVYSMRSIDLEDGKVRKFADMLIFNPRNGFTGLALELKQSSIVLKDGTLTKSKHVQKQLQTLEEMRALGWMSCFGVGIEQCKYIVSEYLGGQFNSYNEYPYFWKE